MFRLSASLGSLQVLLNYEGSGCATLSQVRVQQGQGRGRVGRK